jgi:SAM-dependent methyltransferase
MDPLADSLRSGYAPIAAAYAESLADELRGKPLDRALLDAFAEETRGSKVLEIGSGPGQIARYLRDRGAEIEGLDLSPEMIREAERLHAGSGIGFRVGDMFALPHADASLGGVVAFYAIVHVKTDALAVPFGEIARVLAPGGLALVAFHIGAEVAHVDELFGVATSLDFRFHPVADVVRLLGESGLEIRATTVREPYEAAEHPSRRAYLLARKPRADSRP